MLSLPDLTVLLLVGGLLILAGTSLVYIMGRIHALATPTEQAILDALMVYAQRGIVAGEKLAVEGLDEVDRELTGADKAAIANGMYDLLPDAIVVLGRSIPISVIKHLITKEQFAALVKRLFDETDAFVLRNRDYLEKQIPAPLPTITADRTFVTPSGYPATFNINPIVTKTVTLTGEPVSETSVG